MELQTTTLNCPSNSPNEQVIGGEEIFHCPYPDCDHKSKWKESVARHEKRHSASGNGGISCRLCFRRYQSLFSFLRHMSSRHSSKLSCPSCNFVGQEFSEFKSHVLAHCATESNNLSCPFPDCGYTSSCKKLLQSHMEICREIHPEIEITITNEQDQDDENAVTKDRTGSWACDECSYKTSSELNLRMHTLIHSGEKPLKCPNLQVNLESSSSFGFACMLCEFIGDSELSALKHAQVHNTRLPSFLQ